MKHHNQRKLTGKHTNILETMQKSLGDSALNSSNVQSQTYLLSKAGKVGTRWVWHHGRPLSVPCSQLFPLVCLQMVAEAVADLAVLLCFVDEDVALCGGWPGIREQAAVLILPALSFREQGEAGLTIAEEII